jgi:hypothetical protein
LAVNAKGQRSKLRRMTFPEGYNVMKGIDHIPASLKFHTRKETETFASGTTPIVDYVLCFGEGNTHVYLSKLTVEE